MSPRRACRTCRATRASAALPDHCFALALITVVALSISALIPTRVLACGGAPPLVCGRTTVLVKAMPFMVIVGPAGVVVPVPVMVIVSAAPAPPPPPCPFPVSTTITLTAVCFPPPPPPGGVGVTTIPTPTPGVYFAAVPIFIPPGPLIRFCPVAGTAATTWADGVVTTGAGDTVICVVEPSPGDPSVPRLNMELLTPEIQEAHPGDQRLHTIRLSNNDPTDSVTLTLAVTSTQVSRLPTMSPPAPAGSGDGPYSFSDVGTGDNFPVAFADDLLPTPPPGHNYLLDDGTGEDGIGLTPAGAIIWLNQFTVQPGREVIDKIGVAYGPGVNGKPVSVLLYDDPNNDGNPIDAVLLARADAAAANAGTNTYNDVKITPTDVGVAGESYFIGVVMQQTGFPPELPARLDTTSSLNRSWVAAADPCEANVVTLSANPQPPALISSFGFPGNFMLRAHGGPDFPKVPCMPLPPDPMAFLPPTITRPLVLCPGEVKVIHIATRSWPMCANGSCSEQVIRASGTWADGTDALGCLGVALHANTAVAPDYECVDGGVICRAEPQPPGGIQFFGSMPTHPIHAHTRPLNSQIIPQGFPPMNGGPPQISLLDPEHGRISIPHQNLPLPVDSFFDVFCVIEIAPKIPVINTEIIELHLHTAAPIMNDAYFHTFAVTRVTGPGIPPTLDSFFDVFYAVSLDGITSGLHRPARILPSTIQLQILDPLHFRMNFRAVFPSSPGLPPFVERIQLMLDPQANATGLPNPPQPHPTGACCLADGGCVILPPDKCLAFAGAYQGDGSTCAACAPPCPGARGDANCDGAVNFFDIDPFLLALFDPSTYATTFCGGSICTVDANCDGMVNFFDIDAMIACLFGGCPPCP